MKALSLNQPFAELIVSGKKKIELRRWNTHFRGIFLVHAAKKMFADECKRFGFDPKLMETGAIVGMAKLVDVKKYDSTESWLADQELHLAGPDFYSSINGFILEAPVKFQNPIPYKGMLNFFEVHLSDEQIREISS